MAPALSFVLTAALALAPSPAPAPTRSVATAPHAAISDALIRARVGNHLDRLAALGYTGAVLVLRDGKPVVERAWGFADRDKGIRADTRSTWNLGSITKQFTAAAILRLEEKGKLHTTDFITRWFPDAEGPKRAITIHQLLTHTAGFESDYAPGDYVPNTRAEYMARMLAAIIELVTGKEYEAALTDLVLAPAGMTETGYLRPNWAPERIAHGYQDGRDWGSIVDRLRVPGAPFWALRGNGGLQTTLVDMTRWEHALTSNAVLTASSRRKFMTGYVSEGEPGDSWYAYGWAVHPSSRGTRVVEHNGGNGIYVAEFRRLVDEGITIFVTSSVAELSASPVIDAVEQLVFGGEVELPPAAVAIDEKTLAAFAGRWRTSSGEPLDVEARDGHLLVRAGGPSSWLLLKVGDTAQSPRESELGARALAIWQVASRGDAKPLFEALAGSEPLDQLTRQIKALAADRADRLGALKDVSLLGSVRRDRGVIVSTVRLDYERGVVSNVLVWGPDGALRDRIARPLAPAVLVAVGSGAFVRFDLSGGPPDPAVRLERDGATGQIALVAPNGPRVVFTKSAP